MTVRVVIPLYKGVRGNLKQFFYSRNGEFDKRFVWWITPIACYMPDGLAVGELKTVPTVSRYEGQIEFEVWDKLRRATPKLVAKVKIDADDDTYEVELEDYYMTQRLQLEFNLHQSNTVHESQAFRNKTHHGDWSYRDKV
ncbi:virion structural protein [Pseudomonas phage PhiPA3]|uniref:Uncharacterized protein 265 n=1 Tax=Pseudomonas phage PhiPA3 TaxID=998086 RepID=F8SJA4_BPPA3|nr:virion structural protein [Pseudomonas phage PhiPA3]AEH03688.1 hypothetical protein [Pseudomonas phage PhiPA3]